MSRRHKNGAGERRAAPRYGCHKHCLVRFDRRQLDGQAGTVGAEGYVSDLSTCGLGLLLRPAIPEGGTLAITPFDPPAEPLSAHVVRCAPAGRRWRHGCTLKRNLTAKELRAWLK